MAQLQRMVAAAEPRPTTALTIQGLHKEFAPLKLPWQERNARVAIGNLDLVVPAGQAVAIMGPNGAGKSTLLRILATLVLPDQGRVTVGASDLKDGAGIRKLVGWATGDDRSFYWPLSGRSNLEFFATLQGLYGTAGQERIAVVLQQVELTEVAAVAYSAYSSGMRQRLAIARALLHDPALLLLDEPTRSLDPEAAGVVRRLLRGCRDRGQTLLWVTHNTEEALEYCDRLVLMRDGAITVDLPVAAARQQGAALWTLAE